MLEIEKELLKGLLFHKDITQEYLPHIDHNFFSFFPARVIVWAILNYIKKYDKFPNSPELKTFIIKHEKKIQFSEDELKKKKEWEQITYFLKVLETPEKFQILNTKQFKEELAAFIKKHKALKNIHKLKQAIHSGRNIENALDNMKSEVETVQEDFDRGINIESFLTIKKAVRYGIVPTGLETVDYYMDGGLAKKELGMIAAAPGLGKSTIFCNFAFNAIFLGTKTIYITLEMTPEQIFQRMVSIYTGIPARKFKDKTPREVLEEHNIDIKDVKEVFEPIIIKYFPPGSSIYKIKTYITQMKKHENFDGIVFIDYLNEITYPRISETWAQMEKITTILDNIASELDLPIWIASQAGAKAENKIQFNIKDLYGGKVGATKKLSFGLGITRRIKEDQNRVVISFFKNRLHGLVMKPVELEYDPTSGKINEYSSEAVRKELEIGFDTPNSSNESATENNTSWKGLL